MSGSKKQEYKEYLDKYLSRELQELLERSAEKYKKYGMEKQAKKIRAFKSHAKEMVGKL